MKVSFTDRVIAYRNGASNMKRIDIYLTDEQNKWLVEKTKKLGLSGKSELLRRILDKEIKDGK